MMTIFVMVNISNIVFSQMRYAIVGTYKGASAQGMAIHQDKAYLFSHGGRCRVLNLKTKIVEREFLLESSDSTNHVNCACFGVEVEKGNQLPLIYISECKNGRRCFVECITETTSVLRQTIEARKDDGSIEPVLNWVVDTNNDFLYSITRYSKELKETGIIHNYISKYPLPKLKDGSRVILKERHKLDAYDIPFRNVLQGAKVYNGKLYIVTGLQQPRYEKSKNAVRELLEIDLNEKKLIKRIDLTYVTTNEPEDIDFYEDKCLLYCGQNGGIYEIDLR